MTKTFPIWVLGTFLLTTVSIAEAQQTKKVYRIGFLTTSSASASESRQEVFRKGLRDLGWIEGKNIFIERRYADANLDQLPALAAQLVQLKVDIIVTSPNASALAAKRATTTIPIVMASGGDPVVAGLVASLARPGGNVTGVTTISPELAGKRLELLKDAVGKLTRVAVLRNPTMPEHVQHLKEIEPAARALGIQVQTVEAQSAEDFDKAFSAVTAYQAGALLILRSSLTGIHARRIREFASNNRLPTMYDNKEVVEAGGLISYGVDLSDLYRRTAVYVDKILNGAKPADLPVEQPSKFELVINLKTAKQIGLTIPQRVLQRADKVIR
jgi:ABC-type uncharacterized transport system substrate-binding protein